MKAVPHMQGNNVKSYIPVLEMVKDSEHRFLLSGVVSVDMEIRLFFGPDLASGFDFVLAWESPPTSSCHMKSPVYFVGRTDFSAPF
jgi:hypothetical protein